MGSIHPTEKRDHGKHTRIDPNQSYQLAYWKQRFGISDEELIEAVRATDGLAKNVEAYLTHGTLIERMSTLYDLET